MICELNNAFKDYVFIENNHTYLHKPTGVNPQSVTSYLKSISPKFDDKYWSLYKTFQRNGYDVKYEDSMNFLVNGNKFNVLFDSEEEYDFEFTTEDLKEEWALLGKIGTTRGSFLHNHLENLWNRKQLIYDSPQIINRLPAIEAIKYIKSIEILKDLAEQLYDTLSKTRTLVATEYIVGDIENLLAGTFDCLLYNNETNEYELWDYKTDKKFTTSKELFRQFFIPFSTLTKYSLQLGIYKYILEKYTSIKIGKCFIVHFNFKKNVFDIIETTDYSENIKDIFDGNNRSTHFKY